MPDVNIMNPQTQCPDTRYFGKTSGRLLWLALTGLIMVMATVPARAENLSVTGALVSGACSLKTSDIEVDTGQVNMHFFYTATPPRTVGTDFDITLQGCDLSVARNVTIAFGGTEDTELPGLLLPSGSHHSGLAFGIETPSGQLIGINKPGQTFPLNSGDTVVHLKGFIEAEPDAVTHQAIVAGPIDGTATFRVDYP